MSGPVPQLYANMTREQLVAQARLYAESAARVFATKAASVRSFVERRLKTPSQGLAMARRKYDALRAEYFARDWVALYDIWDEHGPEKAWREMISWATATMDQRRAEEKAASDR